MQPLIEGSGLVKRYGQVQALRGADFTVFPAEVVALIGDNGAGKSTLTKTLAGTERPDEGRILFEGRPVTMERPTDARKLGIETVYQDLALAPDLDGAANLFLGRELLRRGLAGRLGVLDKATMRERAVEAFARLGVELQDVDAPIGTLSGGQRQSVAIARAVAWADKVVFMDEPTAALGVLQRGRVMDVIRRVRDNGIAVVLISHNMPEVLSVADRVEVLRLGRRVARFVAADTTVEELVGAMTGALDGLDGPDANERDGPDPAEHGRLDPSKRTGRTGPDPDDHDESDNHAGSHASHASDGPDAPDAPDTEGAPS